MAVWCRLAGPVEVRVRGEFADIGTPRQRCVLAVLLMEPNSVVAVSSLIDRVWGDDPPASVRNTLYAHIARLRRALGPEMEIIRRSGGYLLSVDQSAVDIHRFRQLVTRARAAGDEEASSLYGYALELWQGTPLADVTGDWATHTRAALVNEWAAAVLERNALELRLGRHAALLPELRALLAERPLDERLAAQFMVAAYRSGCPAEALAMFTDIKTRLADELGADPSPELRRTHSLILRDDPSLGTSKPVTAPVPAELLMDIPDFTGRTFEVDLLCRALAKPGPVRMVAINGPGGIGKSTLAIHAAHRLRSEFPDGQLYVDLQGATAGLAPLTPGEVLDRWLHTLGDDVGHVHVSEAAGRFRSLVAGRKLLVVLDNALDAAQVRPLLPASPGCAVLITSRRALTTLAGAEHVSLDVLSEESAVALLAPAERVAAEPAEARAIVGLCGLLPLAVRIAGARLAVRPHWSLADLAARLADSRKRLDELQVADLAVRAGFAIGYEGLSAEAARLFRLIGLLDGPDFGVRIAAALVDGGDVEELLYEIVDAQLLGSPAPGRFRMHDLIRLYAREFPAPEDARQRAFHAYLADARQASVLLHPSSTRRLPQCSVEPSLTTSAEAISWVDTERANLVATVHQAAPADAIALAAALFRPFDIRGHWTDLIVLLRLAATSARSLGDAAAEAQSKEDMAYVYGRSGQYAEAIAAVGEAMAIYQESGDTTGEASCLDILGRDYMQLRRYSEAVECLTKALRISRTAGHRRGEARVLNTLGLAYQRMGQLAEAITCHTDCLEIDRDLENRYGQGVAYANLGWAHLRAGRAGEAIGHHTDGLTIAREVGDRYLEAEALWGLGQAQHALGQGARATWDQAITILHELGLLSTAEAGKLVAQSVPDTPEIIVRST
ncbi:tetratricopeptide repeat protein [Kibdelosporangium philippinense]|uniref:Tetratricopeptide repeat protein n=1 Tax=Kibdelosporangium philippinense TaxID=211113 RepID=A0ABS8ZC91_9PSEU|nr:BTAD domain-containing putative transcriptional regulator [Kibdelosporangium philippinense]MCE7004301.1 tetratricopeptide repeat protein [Kibdelosporangium philippinense]